MGERDTSPEREAEIRRRVATNEDDVGDIEALDLLAMLDEARALAYLGDHHFPDLTWKARCAEAAADLRAAEARAEAAEAALAALREAASTYRSQRLAWIEADGRPSAGQAAALATAANVLDATLADTAPAADAYRARVRREVLLAEADGLSKRAADDRAAGSGGPGDPWGVRAAFLESEAARLRARADEIERTR